MNLNSKKYPNITYERGQEIFLSPDEVNSAFYFDVEEELTENDEAMSNVAAMLDEVDALEEAAKVFLKKTLENEQNEYYRTVAFFMEFHRNDIDCDTAAELFSTDDPSALSFAEMVDYLKIKRFGSSIDRDCKEQIFIMDLSFDPEITDELMVVYFDLNKQIIHLSHES